MKRTTIKRVRSWISIPMVPLAPWVAVLLALSSPWAGRADDSPEAGLAARLASSGRSEQDRGRDPGRRPADVVAFLGIESGMTVVDLLAAGGYYTEVLSLAVGPSGKVYAQNTPFLLQMREGANEKAIAARLEGGRLPNVERLDRDFDALGLAPGSVDAAITALNFHDIYNSRGAEAAGRFLQVVLELLEPGGVLGVVDHAGVSGADNASLHRIEQQKVVDSAKAAGFEVEAVGEMLRNAADDHRSSVFKPGIRGKTDRFVLRLRKPR